MPRTLATMPREAFEFFVPSKVLRAGDSLNTVYAMHWDGTYRDRIWANSRLFWSEDPYIGDTDYSEDIISAATVAKHLASDPS